MKVWIEAYRQYLTRVCTKSELKRFSFDQLSDDEISKLFFQYIEEKDIEQKALQWVHEYCRRWK